MLSCIYYIFITLKKRSNGCAPFFWLQKSPARIDITQNNFKVYGFIGAVSFVVHKTVRGNKTIFKSLEQKKSHHKPHQYRTESF